MVNQIDNPMVNQIFTHLHIHSEYSIVDGLLRIEELVEKLAAMGCQSVALTDQSNLFAMVKFYQAAMDAGIKPIIGVDSWVMNEQDKDNPFRLILLCQNTQGYRNLTELVSRSYLQGQWKGQPQIHPNWFAEHHQGLIAIAAHQNRNNNNPDLYDTVLEQWAQLFPDRFYLEITRLNQTNDASLQAMVTLAEKKGYPLVATNDVRFLEMQDFEAHEARVCIQEGYVLNDPARQQRYSNQQYLKTPQEMAEIFEDLPEALANSVEIAKRCTLELTLNKVYLPNYPVSKGNTIEEHLTIEANLGLQKRFAERINLKIPSETLQSEEASLAIPNHYLERLNTELQVLNSMGYAGYFLIVADFIRWAKENKIPVGPGRGSGAGSLVAYALEITGLDPIQYDLLFERFLNPERVSMPDFDIDFCMDGRDRVIEYVAERYGRESVSQIITYGTMAAKAVIRDVGRVLGHPYGFVDKIAKLIPLELGITLDKALKEEETLKQRYADEEEVRILIDLAKKLEGVIRNAGKHAGGVVIAPSKLTDFTPLYCDETHAQESEVSPITQFDKNDVETIGLVKFDFLGLRTLTIIDWALQTVNEMRSKNNEPPIDINAIPLDDQHTFDLLRTCNTTAVFQLESRGMKDLVRRLQPDVFEEIIALVALFRPGPLQSGMVDDFINRKHGRAKPEYLHPKLTHVLKPTYGIILYQEQVMQIAQVLAGYTLGGADLLRRAMGKKKPEEMAKQRAIFVQGAIDRGVDARNASMIFDLMEKFAGYGFNKSHSAAYALITYQTAWLKTHYKEAFMAAVLSSDMNHTDKVVGFIEDCRLQRITVLPPNVNKSLYKFSVAENLEINQSNQDNQAKPILYGLGALKGVGEAAINSILEARKHKPFQDLFDFCARVDNRRVSRRVLEALIRSGAMDCFNQERSLLMANLEDALSAAEQLMKNHAQGQGDLFGDSFSESDIGISINSKMVEPWSDNIRLQGEKETLGLYLTGHPLEQYDEELQRIRSSRIKDLRAERNQMQTIAGLISNIRTLNTKRGDRMAFITVDDRSGRQEIAVFSEQFRENKDLLVKDNLVIIKGEVGIDDFSGGYKMRCVEISSLEKARLKTAKTVNIRLASEEMVSLFSEKLMQSFTPYIDPTGCFIHLVYKRSEADVLLKLGEQWRINPLQSLLDNLKLIAGVECVSIGY